MSTSNCLVFGQLRSFLTSAAEVLAVLCISKGVSLIPVGLACLCQKDEGRCVGTVGFRLRQHYQELKDLGSVAHWNAAPRSPDAIAMSFIPDAIGILCMRVTVIPRCRRGSETLL